MKKTMMVICAFYFLIFACVLTYSQKKRVKTKIAEQVDDAYEEWLGIRDRVLKSSEADLRKNLEETLFLQHRRHFTKKEIDARYAKVLKEFNIPLTKDNIAKLKAKFRKELEAFHKKQKKQLEKLLQADRWRVDAYGKIVDQYGKPVSGALIKYSVLFTRADSDSTYFKTFSDKNGFFHIAPQKKIYSLSVKFINKKGYVYIVQRNSFCNNPKHRDSSIARYVDATREIPAVFRMRKKEAKPTFLLRNERSERDLRVESGGEAFFSFVLNRQLDPTDTKEKKLIDSENYDLKMTAVYDEKTSDWTVTLTATGKRGG
ncbi:MAG: hypothetical protein GXP32_03420, partial [Kiritimatiellaeota bacterium]|nr:hypothetical protein [Kiritimatiellota bacterium]